ncbi:MAG: molecular chaperone DnaJ [Puniceicoccaceae bacterium]|nr:MAG: molecular chaperone DnaJ [Puniceicoccaceae bacterium]
MSRAEHFRQLLRESPANPLFTFSLGQALYQEERYNEAVDPLETCRRLREDWMVPRILLGKALLALDRKDEAVPVLREALRLAIDQDHEDPREEVRSILAGLGEPLS